MSGSNQFLPIATGGGANALTPAAYAALTTLLANGYQSGTASSTQINTTLRQSSFVAAAVAQLLADITGFSVLDNGVVANFESQLAVAMGLLGYGLDTGTANAYIVTFNPAELGIYDGLRIRWRALNANTGASTLNINGLGNKPIWSTQHAPLISGEIVVAGEVEVVWNASLNSGAGAWVLLECTGGAQQLPAGSYGVTPALGDNTTKIATTAFVQAAAVPGMASISASVSANALTVGYAGATVVQFRNPTLTTGSPVSATIASALSLVVPSGATLGTTSAVQAQLALVLLYNAGAPVLGIVNIAGGVNLDETTLLSTTAISAAATSASTVYSTVGVTNSPFRVVGYLNITEATAGTWATGPSLVQGQGGQALAAMSNLGYGQTWQSVTRTSGVTYYNTTPRPIVIKADASSSNPTSYTSISINGVSTGYLCVSNEPSGSTSETGQMIIPIGASYVLTDYGSPTRSTWELR